MDPQQVIARSRVIRSAQGSVEHTAQPNFRIDDEVRANGQYNLTFSSGTFWGDYPALLSTMSERIPDSDLLEASPPHAGWQPRIQRIRLPEN